MAPTVSPVSKSAYDYKKRENFAFPPEMSANFVTTFMQVHTSFAQIQTKPEGIRDAVRSELKSPDHIHIGEIASEELRTPTEMKDLKKSATIPIGQTGTNRIVREPKAELEQKVIEKYTPDEKMVERDKPEKNGPVKSSTETRTSIPSSHMPESTKRAVVRNALGESLQVRPATNQVQRGSFIKSTTKLGITQIELAKNNRTTNSKSIAAKGATIYRTKTTDVPAQVSRALAKIISLGGGRTILRLNPKSLGKIRIDVHLKSGVASAKLHAEQKQTRELMLSHVDSLRANLEKRGIVVERVEIGETDTHTGGLDSDAERQMDEKAKERSYRHKSLSIENKISTSSQVGSMGGRHHANENKFSESSDPENIGGIREIRLDTVA